jgi:predicted transposase/invertase (TIGR01784 family)
MAEGMEKGRAEGEANERMKNARSLKDNGVPLDVIAKSLGLTDAELQQL